MLTHRNIFKQICFVSDKWLLPISNNDFTDFPDCQMSDVVNGIYYGRGLCNIMLQLVYLIRMFSTLSISRYFPVANLTRTRQAVIIEPLRPEKFYVKPFNATSLYVLSICEVREILGNNGENEIRFATNPRICASWKSKCKPEHWMNCNQISQSFSGSCSYKTKLDVQRSLGLSLNRCTELRVLLFFFKCK